MAGLGNIKRKIPNENGTKQGIEPPPPPPPPPEPEPPKGVSGSEGGTKKGNNKKLYFVLGFVLFLIIIFILYKYVFFDFSKSKHVPSESNKTVSIKPGPINQNKEPNKIEPTLPKPIKQKKEPKPNKTEPSRSEQPDKQKKNFNGVDDL